MFVRLTALSVLVACTSSTRTPTSQLDARITATIVDSDHTLHVGIDLDKGINTTDPTSGFYEIEPDEHVRIGFRDQTLDLLYRAGTYDLDDYQGTLRYTGDVAAGEEIRVEIDRGSDDDVTLTAPAPPPFTLAGPATWMPSQELTITWTPVSTEPMAWQAAGDFNAPSGPIPNDTGTITFPIGVLDGPPVALQFSRTRTTAPVSPLRGCTFAVTQERDILVERETP